MQFLQNWTHFLESILVFELQNSKISIFKNTHFFYMIHSQFSAPWDTVWVFPWGNQYSQCCYLQDVWLSTLAKQFPLLPLWHFSHRYQFWDRTHFRKMVFCVLCTFDVSNLKTKLRKINDKRVKRNVQIKQIDEWLWIMDC